MPLTIITSDRFVDHVTPPGHPERPARAEALAGVARRWRDRGVPVLEPRLAEEPDLVRVHDAAHVAAMRATAGQATMIDADTFTSPDSWTVGRLAAGAALTAVDAVLDGPAGSRAFALVRPPGHHAERDKAMGFCLFNSIAVGAAHARARGLARVAVMDYDVHHGNGTQQMFYDDPDVFFVSTHQFPFYPGTGAAGETGQGDGAGYTLNVPLEAGATDADYDLVFREAVVPALMAFKPDLLLVSAGFDAHADDPLAGMRMSAGGFARLTAHLCAVADACCEGRMVLMSEGGYQADALAECASRAVAVAAGEERVLLGEPIPGDDRRGRSAVQQVHAAVRLPFHPWPR
ncbi:MAG: histone deacetylase [Vicinamibacterales bacterium]|nr:histone deacetylase [Vicinamibacterales bacterium]